MDKIAYYLNKSPIYWSSIIISLGIIACLMLTIALYRGRGGRVSAVLLFSPIAIVLGVFLARAIHYDCHPERYGSLSAALTNLNEGEFCLAGIHIAILITVLVLKLLGLIKKPTEFFDCFVPGYTLLIAFFRLSAYFNTTCRSKIIIADEGLRMLPFASPVSNTNGVVEWRFATFFVEFLVLLVIFAILIWFYAEHRNDIMKKGITRRGNTSMMFLLLVGCAELIFDSTRYDASFSRFNSFVSITQLVSAVFLVFTLVVLSVRSVKVNRLRPWHFAIWIGFLLGVAGVGFSEYWVQRHGNLYVQCYTWMTMAIAVMIFVTCFLYSTICDKRKRKK